MCKWLPNLTMVEILLVNVILYLWITNDVVNKIMNYSVIIFMCISVIDGINILGVIWGLLFILSHIDTLFKKYDLTMFVVNGMTKRYMDEEVKRLENFDKKYESLPYLFG